MMAKELETIEPHQPQAKHEPSSREDINSALTLLDKIAVNLPPVDVVVIVREGRDHVGNKNS